MTTYENALPDLLALVGDLIEANDVSGNNWCLPEGVRAPLLRAYTELSEQQKNPTNPAAVTAGMTEREAEVWERVAKAAGSYLRLTDDETHHPMEREEICHAFHIIQGWLAGRPFLRALGVK